MSNPTIPVRRSLILAVSVLAALTLGACASGPTGVAQGTAAGAASEVSTASAAASASPTTKCADSSGSPKVQQVDTQGYRMVLAVGDREAMYTQAEVDAKSPMTGELMVAGTMMDPGRSPMGSNGMGSTTAGTNGGATRHVEVAICDLATGVTVTGADVRMSVAADGAPAQDVSVAEMRGLDEPATETHYGNNIPMSGGSHVVTFTINGQTGTFQVTP
jgi:hypothetical protein